MFSIHRFLDFLLPHRCFLCHENVEGGSGLCSACWVHLTFISDPCCHVCGVPFEFTVGPYTKCLTCLDYPPVYTQARAPVLYQGPMKEMILRFKHADETYMAPVFARWITRACQEQLYQCDGLLAVPLHWRRLLKRKYNQAALLARYLEKLTDIPFYPQLLKRHRATPVQGVQNKIQRQRNVEKAFSVSTQGQKIIQGKNWCLVDDVLTSGATVSECARVLKEHGAEKVYVVTLARTPLHDSLEFYKP
jgi:ComF family protein